MGPEMTISRLVATIGQANGWTDWCQTLKDERWHMTAATGSCLTPCSRGWFMPSVAMIYQLPIAIAEGSSKLPNQSLPTPNLKVR